MTSQPNNQDYGPPPPITKLTVEQDLQLRLLYDKLNEGYHDKKDDIITFLMALQRQNFALSNSITNLVQKWPPPPTITDEVLPMFGILLETKD